MTSSDEPLSDDEIVQENKQAEISEGDLNDEGSQRSRQDEQCFTDDRGLAIQRKQRSESKSWSQQWSRTIREQVHRPILRAIHQMTKAVVKYPKSTLTLIACLSILLFCVGLATNFTLVVDEHELWTPFDSLATQTQTLD